MQKKLVHRILLLNGYENDDSSIVRLHHEDEETWSIRTNLYFERIGAILKEKKH